MENGKWLPGVLVSIGGMYTSLYLYQVVNELQESVANTSNLLLKAVGGLAVMTSGALIVPIVIGIVVAILGIIMLWKHLIILPIITAMLSMVMFNWGGFLVTLLGSGLAFFLWREQRKSTFFDEKENDT